MQNIKLLRPQVPAKGYSFINLGGLNAIMPQADLYRGAFWEP